MKKQEKWVQYQNNNQLLVQIRKACQEDIKRLSDIEKECFPEAEAASYQELSERFDAFGDCFLVAEYEGQLIGFINGCMSDETLLADELYHDVSLHKPNGQYQMVFGLDVLPAYRQQGVAGELLNGLIQLAYQRHLKGVVLTCKNHLIGYYEKFGFVHQGISDSQHGGAIWNDMLLLF